ncbi:Gfo/Idh/MocA family protein [Microvirga arsenatis]|uniref:Gfo/Idh/MocA family oxidoreductase n=1 Tax=Microvirga arsenatis TaxID=2692265 RepID=A0ABW9YWQ4_9HYPH|nr:Gfo/Idh/MocA family oxidoreductase [Microvirga arsenatis]NBJ10501.1 Gfo/Idh/MocA family oxidoreductase [Microvirga arsenatis]NBJ24600.1 Gfo/Idh/MocA family oxidoreductase [Microvirga arsenatis]
MTIAGSADQKLTRRLRLGMVGGGRGAFIGAVHRIAARIDDRWELVAGALSSDPERAKASGEDLLLKPDRIYGDFNEMARRERRLKDGIDAVAIVTPNHAHAAAARAFLKAGIHVICDKPLTTTRREADQLAKLARDSGLIFAVTHNYTGYPLVRQARAMVQAGELGAIRVVQVEYAQDWLATRAEETGSKQAEWRTDPARSGPAGAVGDIGTHAFNLAEFIVGDEVASLSAELHTFVEGRRLDDNAHMMLRFASGAKGMLWCSQVAAGLENGLRIRVYGEKAGLEWHQENPNYLTFSPLGEPPRLIRRNGYGADEVSRAASRIPGGHPEGYLEGFAQLYTDVAEQIAARIEKREPNPFSLQVPTVEHGVRGVRFIEAAVKSSQRKAAWVDL